jgi:hypothetical protein
MDGNSGTAFEVGQGWLGEGLEAFVGESFDTKVRLLSFYVGNLN